MALHEAMKPIYGHFQTKRILEKAGADQGDERLLALAQASESGELCEVVHLLESGADPNAGPFHPLMEAASYGYAEVVDALVRAGAYVNRSERGRPLACPIRHDDTLTGRYSTNTYAATVNSLWCLLRRQSRRSRPW